MTSVVRAGVIAVLTAAFIALIRSTSASCNYEIWIVDQADSNNGTALIGYGGYIYIFKSRDLKKAHEIIDLGGEVSRLCFQQTALLAATHSALQSAVERCSDEAACPRCGSSGCCAGFSPIPITVLLGQTHGYQPSPTDLHALPCTFHHSANRCRLPAGYSNLMGPV
ncbi:hypothetical protein VOLCADRAFT_108794 [Volvox carteri f. nagariensis]|uniref:Pherophorin domain-containing protein n=1 Tax=Volvox carteri f. nagariensis TaxID=3068 RepID=D8UMM2_VOLCA|nr:uncharacterized protein VOLCADRAFT_108794 [Volvox carteri f. nagariensis]EFJ39027.1 hypothetical protein VOLCADRAFT_108794 [Volvox carteri f. nagariensis]|eukprot:XP_002959908.1 hypothetical protein VOLCADRAFT_108794 [Volvox carteri f. nagariensis]